MDIMKLTEPEWLIMSALWEEHPATVSEVAERLADKVNWAYSTFKTTLDRLVQKQIAGKHKRSNLSFYEPILTQKEACSTALKSLLDHGFDGAFGRLMLFLVEDQKLTPKQKKELIKILEENRKPKGKNK
jgi:BlaI family penicillinase repressor